MQLDHHKVWRKCLEYLNIRVESSDYRTWFEPIVPLKLTGEVLTIQVPSLYFYEIIEERYIDLVSRCLKEFVGPNAKLEYNVVMDKGNRNKPVTIDLSTSGKSGYPNGKNTTIETRTIVNPQLNSDYTFENFIEGDCNKLAISAGLSISQKPGTTAFNPLFIFGKSGLGKTHIAQAIGAEAKIQNPQKNVLYVTANAFETQFTESHKANTRNDFINFYQMIDVLIIDDIQEFAAKRGTQNAFFHIFNHLHQTKKQLVFTCDQAPADLQGMEERLLSRFKWGLPTELTVPDFKTRLKILEHKMKKDGIQVPPEVVQYIATHVTKNVRELESVLVSMLALSTLNKSEINIKSAENIINKLVKRTPNEISPSHIKDTVCNFYGIEPSALQTKSRKREIVQARQIAMYFSKNYTNYSLSAIGAIMGKKDHATVLHACKQITNLLETDKSLKNHIVAIEAKLMC